MRTFISAAVVLLFGLPIVIGCAGTPMTGETKTDKLIHKRPEKTPDWIDFEPEIEGDKIYFIGISRLYATEQGARKDAARNAIDGIVQHMGTLAQEKVKQAVADFGLDSAVVDPTSSTLVFKKYLSGDEIIGFKTKEWYTEKWQTPTGTGWKVYVLADLPLSSANNAIEKTINDKIKEAEEKARKAANARAKAQARDAAEFWESLSKDEFFD